MTRADFDRFTNEVMKPLFLMFRERPDDDLIVGYFADLADLDLDTVCRAATTARRTLTFFPKVGELRSLAGGTLEQRSALAWARVYGYRGWGDYRPITFNDLVIHAAIVAMGGWTRIGHLALAGVEPVEVATARKEFERYYGIYATTGVPVGTPAALCTDPALLISTIPVALDAHPPQAALGSGQQALPEPKWDEMPPEFKAVVDRLAVQMRPVERVTVDRPAFTPLAAEEWAELDRKKRAALAAFKTTPNPPKEGDDR